MSLHRPRYVKASDKAAPALNVNGWAVEKLPNSFAERFVWTVEAVDANGYRTAQRGFQTKHEAVAFAAGNTAPAERSEAPSALPGAVLL